MSEEFVTLDGNDNYKIQYPNYSNRLLEMIDKEKLINSEKLKVNFANYLASLSITQKDIVDYLFIKTTNKMLDDKLISFVALTYNTKIVVFYCTDCFISVRNYVSALCTPANDTTTIHTVKPIPNTKE